VSDQQDTQENAYLFRVNAELIESLGRCHVLIDDCRAKLVAANSNEPFLAADTPGAGEGDESVG
jgi:hypothetical protein